MASNGRIFGIELGITEMAPLCAVYERPLEEIVQSLFLGAYGLFGKRVYLFDGVLQTEVAVTMELGFREFGQLEFFPISTPSRTGITLDYARSVCWFNNPAAAILRRIGARYKISQTSLAEDILRFALHAHTYNLSVPHPDGFYYVSSRGVSHRIYLIA